MIIYTSIGKIESILVTHFLPIKLDSIDSGMLSYGRFKSFVKYKYDDFIRIIKSNSITIYIAIDIDEIKQSERPNSIFNNIEFPILDFSDGFIDSWVQDAILVTNQNAIQCYHCIDENCNTIEEKISIESLSKFCEYKIFSSYIDGDSKKPIAGGNIMMGRFNMIDYLIVGPNNITGSYDDSYLKKLLNNNQISIFHFDIKDYITSYKKLLFHLDLYLMIVGEKYIQKTKKELILVGQFYSDSNNINIKKHLNIGIGKLKENILSKFIPFYIINIPIVIIDKNSILSYCNCHVENYKYGVDQKIKIYFPRYTKTLQNKGIEYFEKNLKENNFNTIFLPFWNSIRNHLDLQPIDVNSIYLTETNIMIEKSNITPLNQLREDFITDTELFSDLYERKIRSELSLVGITDIEFIDHSFYTLSSNRHGSLHCMSLVTKRGPHGFD